MPHSRRTPAAPAVGTIVSDCLTAPWTAYLLEQVRRGHTRVDRIDRSLPGLTAKVVQGRLQALVRLGVLERRTPPAAEAPVEFVLTPLGVRVATILDSIDRLQHDLDEDRLRVQAPPVAPLEDVLPLLALASRPTRAARATASSTRATGSGGGRTGATRRPGAARRTR